MSNPRPILLNSTVQRIHKLEGSSPTLFELYANPPVTPDRNDRDLIAIIWRLAANNQSEEIFADAKALRR
jgi:hypothetical protein